MPTTWKNWSGSVQTNPAEILQPTSEAEVQSIVRKAASHGQKIRLVGAGHSFTPLAATDQLLVSLDGLSGLIEHDATNAEAEVWAGTRLKVLGELLYDKGLGMENLGDIDVQSIAGAVSTGTHGTGTSFGTLATQVCGMTLVTADGQLRRLDPESTPDEFRAAQVSLGTLGIITRIRLRCVPAFKLRFTMKKSNLEAVLTDLPKLLKRRHFEFYWFPYTETVQTRTAEVTDEAVRGNGLGAWLNDLVLENGIFKVINIVSKVFKAHKSMARLCAKAISAGSKVNWSHRIYATQRLVKFQEMEYNIPAEHLETVLREVQATILREKFPVNFPIEVRWVKGDSAWLSPATGRDSAYIAVHMYRGKQFKSYFTAMEQIFKRFGGRPHWGKMHFLKASDLAERYPDYPKFCRLRTDWDPNGLFLNDYLAELFPASLPASNAIATGAIV